MGQRDAQKAGPSVGMCYVCAHIPCARSGDGGKKGEKKKKKKRERKAPTGHQPALTVPTAPPARPGPPRLLYKPAAAAARGRAHLAPPPPAGSDRPSPGGGTARQPRLSRAAAWVGAAGSKRRAGGQTVSVAGFPSAPSLVLSPACPAAGRPSAPHTRGHRAAPRRGRDEVRGGPVWNRAGSLRISDANEEGRGK